MPRKSNRGGARTGTPGTAYGNRTDLNQPVQVAPSKQYGQGVQQAAAQQAIPLPNSAGAAAPSAPAAAPVASPMPQPSGPFDRPTEMPSEPITTGLPMGAGAGPEAIPSLSANPDDEDLVRLRPYLPALELLANLPNASAQTRNYVRRLRGSMPIQQPGA